MANESLHKLQVEIEGNDAKLKAATKDAISNVRSFVRTATSGMKDVRESMSNTGVESARSSLKEFRVALKSVMADIKVASGTHVYTDDFLNMRTQIEAADQQVEKLSGHLAQLKAAGKGQEDAEFASLEEELRGAAEQADNLRTSLADLVDNGGATKFAGLGRAVRSLAGHLAQLAKSAGQVAAGALRKAGGAAQSLIHRFREGIPLLHGTRSELNGLGKIDLSKGISRILRFAFSIRTLTFLLGRIKGAVKDDFENLAQYSPTVNNNISSLIASLTQLKNALAAAFAPILNVVTPILNFFISKLTAAVNAVGQFLAALTGQKSYVKATAVTANYAAALDNASSNADKANKSTKELKRTLLGFDQIHKLDDNSDTGSDTGVGTKNPVLTAPADMFSTEKISNPYSEWAKKVKEAWSKADFTEIGKNIGTALKNALEKIPWTEIQGTAKKAAKSLATLVNGFISVSGLGATIGGTLAQAINTGIYAIETGSRTLEWNKLGVFIRDTITNVLAKINWPSAVNAAGNIGSGLASAINGALSTDKLTGINLGASIGTAIANAINVALRGLRNFTHDLEWEQVGANIESGITNTLGRIRWQDVQQTARNVGSGLARMLNRFMTPSTFRSVGNAAANALKAVISGAYNLLAGPNGIQWSQWGKAIASGINTFLAKMTPDDWKKAGLTLRTAISGIIKTIKNVIEDTHWDQVGSAIGTMLAELDWVEILKDLGDLIWAAIKAAVEAWKGSFDAAPIETIIVTAIGLLTFAGAASSILTGIGTAFSSITATSALVTALASSIGSVLSLAMPAAAGIAAGVFVSNLLGEITKQMKGGEFAPEGAEEWWHEIIGADEPGTKPFIIYDRNGNPITYDPNEDYSGSPSKHSSSSRNTSPSLVGIELEEDVKTKSADIPVTVTAVNLKDKIPAAKKIINSVKGNIDRFMEKTGIKKTFDSFTGVLGQYVERNGITKTFFEFVGVLARFSEATGIGKIFSNFTGVLGKFTEGTGIGKTFSNFIATLGTYREGIGINKVFNHFTALVTKTTDHVSNKTLTGMTGRVDYMRDNVSNGVVSGITGYVNSVQKNPGITTLVLTGITGLISSIIGSGKASGGMYRGGRWTPITAAAGGGSFGQGQMFIARESGPELVGQIGSGTAVMNNDQIVASVSAGVFRAVVDAFRATGSNSQQTAAYTEFTLNVDGETLYRAVRKGKEQYDGRYNIVENI